MALRTMKPELNNMTIEPILLTPRDAARALSISERSLYALTVPRGSIPCIKSGQLVRYVVEDLRAWAKKKSLASMQGDCVLSGGGKPEHE